MKLSSQEEYGLRCLLRVGRAGPEGSVTISELSRSEGISEPNVAKMMRVLRTAGLVQSTRGQAGGYALARPRLPTSCVLPPIRTFTVGPGISPGQPTAGSGRVADYHRRFGVSPTPEHALLV